MNTNLHNPTIIVRPKPADDKTRRRAEKLFPMLQMSKKLGRKQIAQKKREWVALYSAMSETAQLGAELRVPTGNRGGINHRLRRQVLNAAVDVEVWDQQPRAGRNVRKQYVVGRKWK